MRTVYPPHVVGLLQRREGGITGAEILRRLILFLHWITRAGRTPRLQNGVNLREISIRKAYELGAAALAFSVFSCLGTGPTQSRDPVPDPNPAFVGLRDTSIQESQPLAFGLTATDPQNDALSFSLLGPPGAALAGALFTWTPTLSQSGPHVLRFIARAQNSQRADTALVVVTVLNAPAPVFQDPPSNTVVEEGQSLSFALSAVDSSGAAISYSMTGPLGASLVGNIFAWTPDFGQAGTYLIPFVARNAENPARADTLFVSIAVGDVPLNQIPALKPPRDTAIDEGQPLAFTLSATDPRSLGLTYSLLGPPGAGLQGNAFSWTPTLAQAGDHLLRFVVRDNGAPPRSDTAHMVITVRDVNLVPVLQALRDTTIDEGQPLKFTLAATDAENDLFTFSVIGPPDGGTLTGNVFNWTPDTLQAGQYQLLFKVTQVSDPSKSHSLGVVVTVRNVEGQPIPAGALIAYWDFNEGSGTSLGDKTGGGRNVTLTGSPAWVTGVEGSALRFNGNNYGSSTSAIPDMTEQTFSAWVYLDELKLSCFFSEANTDPGRDNRLGATIDGRVRYVTRDINTDVHDGKAKMQTGKWYYVVGTAKPDTVRTYLNGVLDSTWVGANNLTGSHYRIQIGRFSDGGSHIEDYTKGILDEIKVYNKALTPAQVQQEWNRLRGNVGQ
jgi:hypothetical protein